MYKRDGLNIFSLQMSPLRRCCRGVQATTSRTETQVDWPTRLLWHHTSHPNANMHVTKFLCLSLLVLNLIYIIIPTIPLILLLLTVTGVCCFKVLVRRWGSKTKAIPLWLQWPPFFLPNQCPVNSLIRFHSMYMCTAFCYLCFPVCETEGRRSRNQKYARRTWASTAPRLQLTSTTSFAPKRTMTWFQLALTPKTPPSYAHPLTPRRVIMTTWVAGTRRAASWRLPAQRAASSTLTSMTSALGVVALSTTPAWAARGRGTWMTAVWAAPGTESFTTGVLVVARQRVSIMATLCTETTDCTMVVWEEGVTCLIPNRGLEVTR